MFKEKEKMSLATGQSDTNTARRRCRTERERISANSWCVDMLVWGVVQGGQAKKVREPQRLEHYDYKNRLEEYDAEV